MYKVGTMFILTIPKRTFLYKYTIDLQHYCDVYQIYLKRRQIFT